VKPEHCPALHVPSQRVPQVPQLSGSVGVSTHCPLHTVAPASQVAPPELLPELPPLELPPELLPELPPESLPPELLPEPLLDPEPLDDEDVASLPPSAVGLLVFAPLEQLAGRPMATASAANPRRIRSLSPWLVPMPVLCPPPAGSITDSFAMIFTAYTSPSPTTVPPGRARGNDRRQAVRAQVRTGPEQRDARQRHESGVKARPTVATASCFTPLSHHSPSAVQ